MEEYQIIWETHNGAIPFDEFGRKFHIHHIDGDRSNNSIENLQCVSVQEHYDIHYKQGDYYACYLLANRFLNITKEELSCIRKLVGESLRNTITVKDKRGNYYRVDNTHPDFISGKLTGVTKGLVSAKIISSGDTIQLPIDKFNELKNNGIVCGITANIPLSKEHKDKVSKALTGIKRNTENYGKSNKGRKRIKNLITGKAGFAYPIKRHNNQLTFEDIDNSTDWIYIKGA